MVLFDKDGWMTTGYQNVDGTWYYLRKDGALTYTGVTPIMGSSDISGDKNTVVNKMVKMYQKSGRTYPPHSWQTEEQQVLSSSARSCTMKL